MPKMLNQHQIRQSVIQALFSYKIQHEMKENLVQEFRDNVEKLEKTLNAPIRFDVDFKDERIIIRKFPKKISKPMENLAEIYEIVGVENFDKTALAKALILVRDFGSYAKKMTEEEALELYKGIFANLNLLFLFSIDLDEEPVAPKVLQFLRALPKGASPEQALETFQKVFSILHENVLEKYNLEMFKPVILQEELNQELSKVEKATEKEDAKLLEEAKAFSLNHADEEAEQIEVPEYFAVLVDGVLENQATLIATLSEHLAQKWSFNRLTSIEQTILLLGAYEIIFTETPDLVALNEAIELAKDFSDVKSSRFINGVLTNLVKKNE